MATKQQAELPSPEELDIANYKIGSFISDLDAFYSRLIRVENDPVTIEDYREREAAGDTFETPQLDRTLLAQIVVFADEVIEDAESIKDEAEKIHDKALVLHREQTPREEIDIYNQRVRLWHTVEAAKGGVS